MLKARVFEPELIDKLKPYLKDIIPKPSIYYPDFIASNQNERVNNIIPETTKEDQLEHIRRDIREFKEKNDLGKVLQDNKFIKTYFDRLQLFCMLIKCQTQ